MRDERLDIIEVYQNVLLSANAGDWESWKKSFLEEVDIDYSSSKHGDPRQIVKRDEWLETKMWKPTYAKVPVVMHQLTNHLVTITGDKAEARCYVQALLVKPGTPGGDQLRMYGRYTFGLVKTAQGWKVGALKIEVPAVIGNMTVFTSAAQP